MAEAQLGGWNPVREWKMVGDKVRKAAGAQPREHAYFKKDSDIC